MTNSEVITMFKDLGKILWVGQSGLAHAAAHRSLAWNISRQMGIGQTADGSDPQFKLLTDFEQPLVANLATAAAQEDLLAQAARNAVEAYLTQRLGLDSRANITQIGDALLSTVTAAGTRFEAVADTVPEFQSFYNFFSNNYEIQLPLRVGPDVPDSFITSALV